jgi:hypothetical protein
VFQRGSFVSELEDRGMKVPEMVEVPGTVGASGMVERPRTVQPPENVETPGGIEAPGTVEGPGTAEELRVDQRLWSPSRGLSSTSAAASDPSRNEMIGADTVAG